VKAGLFSEDAQEFLQLLARHDVRYLLVGGVAVIYHGYSRLTGDLGLLYDCSSENCQRLWSALLAFWHGNVPSVAGPGELADPNVVVQFGRPPNRIDLIASLKSVPFAEAWQHRIRERIAVAGREVPVWILSLPELRRSKQEAGRPKDLDDLDHLPK